MIVDDEPGVRESLRAILEGDCEVTAAASGEEALSLAAAETVDVVTLDLRMPGLGGITVLERLKRVDPDVEVLIITGYGSFDTAVQGLRNHAFDYLAKPFEVEQVRRLVHAALARRAAVRRMKAAPEQILATLSHEFRTPLNVIMGYSSMLKEETEGRLSEEQRLVLERIQSNSSALLGYVETLFYMAELDRGFVPVVNASVRPRAVLERVRDQLERQAGAKGLALVVDAPDDLVITSDEDKLTRLVQAIADNSVRYTTAGEIVLTARATAEVHGIAVTVRDTGPGLAPELIAETEDVVSGRPTSGPPRLLGFGLRLTGRLVRALGARLHIAAGPDGTAFRVTLPGAIAVESVPLAKSA